MYETLSPGLASGYCLEEYTIGSVLGIGAFGITYLAHDNHLHQRVVIKEFYPASLAARNQNTGTVGIKSPECETDFNWGKSRYVKEAQTLAQFNHANIVRVYRYFEANRTSYMVMAFEEGKSLSHVLLDDEIDWTQEAILDFVTPLLSGLADVHKVGYLHRDIKPDNILLRTRDLSPVLLDFGSARSMMSDYTMTALVSPGYGPAEQYSSDQGDQGPWTDIYALAAVLYRIVSGQVPVPAIGRIKKDSLLPAIFAGHGRYSKPFLAAIDCALSVDETKRPTNIETWLTLLREESMPQSPSHADSASAAMCNQPPCVQQSLVFEEPEPVLAQSSSRAPIVEESGDPAPRASPTRRISQQRRKAMSSFKLWTRLVVVVLIAMPIAWACTDEGHLKIANFVYAKATQARNTEWRYALVCPSYFQSEMSLADLNGAWSDPATVSVNDTFQSLVVESQVRATINSLVSVNGAPGTLATQTWTKNGYFWCRDVLTDFKAAKVKLSVSPSHSESRTRRAKMPALK